MVASSSFVTSSQKDPLITGSVLLLLYFGVTSSSFDTFAQKDPLIACLFCCCCVFWGLCSYSYSHRACRDTGMFCVSDQWLWGTSISKYQYLLATKQNARRYWSWREESKRILAKPMATCMSMITQALLAACLPTSTGFSHVFRTLLRSERQLIRYKYALSSLPPYLVP